MYRALYRKYRPRTFSDVCGQSHVTETLKNELKTGRISHAYLFTGSRGTGKTSCAQILAKAVNCLDLRDGDPCLECEACAGIASGDVLDIMEIDAASNNGVDNIRDLRERVQFTPASVKYRVYIIDEVHMLSPGAFNALLKTLEEPPEHVIFILATTEVQRLPATILSRCQRFDFKRIEPDEIANRLLYVASKEGFSLDRSAAELIAVLADGGMRDALSILDQCAGQEQTVTEDVVRSVCGMAGREHLMVIADAVIGGDAGGMLSEVELLHNSSVDSLRLCHELLSYFRDLMMIKTVRNARKMIACGDKEFSDMSRQAESLTVNAIFAAMDRLRTAADRMSKGNRRLELEMALIELCGIGEPATAPVPKPEKKIKSALPIAKPAGEENTSKPAAPTADNIGDTPPWDTTDEPKKTPDEKPAASENAEKPENIPEHPAKQGNFADWDKVLDELNRTCPLLRGVLDDSAAYIEGGYLLIDCDNSQFRDMLKGSNPIYKESLRAAAKAVTGQVFKLGPYTKKKVSDDDPFAALINKLSDMEVPEKL